ncbi:MAG: asparagine synthase (glutamine-hydrolyzing) [Leptonema sp. (in: Bacteria)]|nr:asparagine synthase (glutamine-hydrolyzing) [Leptonema sp. (in: bacteria)]
MSGIAGWFNSSKNEKPIDRTVLAGMALIQNHRGGEGFGVSIDNERQVGFSFVSSRADTKPLVVDQNKNTIAAVGNFYGAEKIRTNLTAEGFNFSTKYEYEIELKLFEKFGIESSLKFLRGEFAFAIYDNKHDTLYLVRDRFGIKPLYYYFDSNHFLFSSEIKGIFANSAVGRSFSNEGLFHQLMQTQVPATTPYSNIYQVPPATYIAVKRKPIGGFQIQSQMYWQPNFPLNGEWSITNENNAIEQVRTMLIDSVELRLKASQPVGAYLSGGIDSCSILGLMSAYQKNPIRAFTIGFDDSGYDESQIASRMARSVGADQDLFKIGGNDLYQHFVDVHWHTERTIYNTLGVAKYLMSRHVRKAGYQLVLTGEGSDELFAGYPGFRRDYFLSLKQSSGQQYEQKLQSSNTLFRGAMLSENEIASEAFQSLCGFTPSSLQPWLATGKMVPSILNREIQSKLTGYDPAEAIANALAKDQIEGRHPLDIAQFVWIKTMLECQILTWGGDRVDMAHGMEARPPFMDHQLAELAFQIAPSFRIHNGREKHVLREAMKGVLPEELYNREKFAFMAPPAHRDQSKSNQFEELANQYLSDSAIEDSGLLDKAGIRNLEKIRKTSKNTAELTRIDAILNHALGVQILKRNFIDVEVPTKAKQLVEKSKSQFKN